MILILTATWYTYTSPAVFVVPSAAPEHLRTKHYAGRAYSTLCFDPDDDEVPSARIQYCGRYLTEISVKARYEREGIVPHSVRHFIYSAYLATYRTTGDPMYAWGEEDLPL